MTDKTIVPSSSPKLISPPEKGLGFLEVPSTRETIIGKNWSLLSEDLSLPVAVIYKEKVLHNLLWMQEFITRYGIKLAPHGKTTMAPALFKMQLEGGAWGITLATAQQTQVAYEHGIRRVLMANQLVGKENMEKIGRLLSDRSFEFYCLVDSAENVSQLGSFFASKSAKLNVLLELGVDGGRAGIRNQDDLEHVMAELSRWHQSIALCGVEVYEGTLADESSIRAFLHRTVQTTARLVKTARFDRLPIIISGAGSAWYDIVAEIFSSAEMQIPIEVVLRPGCYLTHDIGTYWQSQLEIKKRNPIAAEMNGSLQPALHIWAYVQSIPEEDKAIIGMGKRDAAFDAGLPQPACHFRPGWSTPTPAPDSWRLTKMMDQHAYLQISGEDIRVGDMIGFDISHPCLTFDKWRVLLVLDSDYRVVDILQTYF